MQTFTINGTTFNATDSQIDAIVQLQNAKAGFGAIHSYIPTTDYVESPIQDEQFCAKFNLETYYRKINEAIRALTVADLDLSKWVPSKGRDACDNAEDQLDLCKAKLMERNIKTLNGHRDDAHRKGHDECHVNVCHGVKVHLVTEKNAEGLKRPVIADNGFPTADCIRVSGLSVRKITVKQGVRKVKKSGSKVLMDNAINKAISSTICRYKSYSLRENFAQVTIGGETITEVENEDKQKFLAACTAE
jgi:hypothetical protein